MFKFLTDWMTTDRYQQVGKNLLSQDGDVYAPTLGGYTNTQGDQLVNTLNGVSHVDYWYSNNQLGAHDDFGNV